MDCTSYMNWNLSALKKSTLFKASSLLFASSVLSNLIGLGGFILLSKVYTPDVLGSIFTITAVAAIINICVVMGYQQAVPLMKDKELSCFFVGLTCLLSVVFVLLSPLLMFYEYWFFISSYVLLGVVSMVSEVIFVRDHQTKRLAFVRIAFPLIFYSFSVLAYFSYGSSLIALMNFQIFALFLRVLIFYRVVLNKYLRKVRLLNVLAVLKKYRKFPRYVGPGIVFSTAAYQIPIVVAGSFISPETAAHYNMAYRMAFAPVQMLGGAITEAYTQFLSARYRSGLNLFSGFGTLRLVLLVLGVISTLSVMLLMPLVVSFFLGEEWQGSIEYIYALIPLLFAVVSLAPVTAIFQFTNSQKYIFYIHLSSLVISLFCFGVVVHLYSFMYGVVCFSIIMLVRYFYVLHKTNNIRLEYVSNE